MGCKGTQSKADILRREQFYIDLYKPILNLNPHAGSSLGFKHSEESKFLIAQSRKGKPLSEDTKARLSALLSGKLNPFCWGGLRPTLQKHKPETIAKMSESKLGELNPMFNKPKSKAFIEEMSKDKTGANNPMFFASHQREKSGNIS